MWVFPTITKITKSASQVKFHPGMENMFLVFAKYEIWLWDRHGMFGRLYGLKEFGGCADSHRKSNKIVFDWWMAFFNILYAIIGILKRCKLSEETGLLLNLKNTLQYHPLKVVGLIRMGVGKILADILKKEIENQAFWNETDDTIPVRIISMFLPQISDSTYIDINGSSNEIISKGWHTQLFLRNSIAFSKSLFPFLCSDA